MVFEKNDIILSQLSKTHFCINILALSYIFFLVKKKKTDQRKIAKNLCIDFSDWKSDNKMIQNHYTKYYSLFICL